MYSPVTRVTLVQFPVADIYLFKKQTYATTPKFVECHPSTKNEPLNSTCIYVTLSCHQSCFSNGRYVLSSMTTVSIISEDAKITFKYCTHIWLYIYIVVLVLQFFLIRHDFLSTPTLILGLFWVFLDRQPNFWGLYLQNGWYVCIISATIKY